MLFAAADVCMSCMYLFYSAAMLFGGVTVVAGIAGTIGGSELSKLLGRWTRKSEALVCSISLFCSIPFLFLALTVVQYKVITVSWIMVFFGVTIICFHWTPVAAILLVSCVFNPQHACV